MTLEGIELFFYRVSSWAIYLGGGVLMLAFIIAAIGYAVANIAHMHEVAVAYWGPIFFEWGWY